MLLLAALVLASITDTLADWVTEVVADIGLPGIFILMAPESACIPIPSEPTMLFAGFAASEGEYSVLAAAMTATVANVVGSWSPTRSATTGASSCWRSTEARAHQPQAPRVGRPLFANYGDPAVFFSRMLPIVRTFISLPAGVARMPFCRSRS